MNRRDLLKGAVTAGTASVLVSQPARSEDSEERSPKLRIVDTNVSLFQWPFRRLPLDDTNVLVKKLRSLGIAQAWAGSLEGMLHRDLAAANQRLAEACGRHPELVPVGSVNPQLPDWQEDLRRCIEQHKMPGIRLHPNYHEYTLEDPHFIRLLERATAAGRFVQIAATMEDTRTQHPLVRAADVELAPLPDLLPRIRGARVQILNHRPRSPLLEKLSATPGVYFDISRVEGTDGIANLLRSVPAGRVMFGTHAPLLIPEAALIRVCESELDDDEIRLLLGESAEQIENKRSR